MIIVGFTHQTSKTLPRLLCRNFRHCAPVVPSMMGGEKPFVMYQFVRRGIIAQIPLNMRDMNLLRKYGWQFVHVDTAPCCAQKGLTCVQFTKRVCGIKSARLQRPDALWRELHKH